jgi:hypothetical protein
MEMTMSNAKKSMADRLRDSVLGVTKDWAKQRRAEERHASAEARRRANLIRPSDYHNFRSASFPGDGAGLPSRQRQRPIAHRRAAGDVPG